MLRSRMSQPCFQTQRAPQQNASPASNVASSAAKCQPCFKRSKLRSKMATLLQNAASFAAKWQPCSMLRHSAALRNSVWVEQYS